MPNEIPPEIKKIILNALNKERGNDLEEVKAKFSRYSEKKLDQRYGMYGGASLKLNMNRGPTCRQVLANATQKRKLDDSAIDWIKQCDVEGEKSITCPSCHCVFVTAILKEVK